MTIFANLVWFSSISYKRESLGITGAGFYMPDARPIMQPTMSKHIHVIHYIYLVHRYFMVISNQKVHQEAKAIGKTESITDDSNLHSLSVTKWFYLTLL